MLNAIEPATLFNRVHNPVFIKNENLHFIFVNKAYEAMFNVKAADIVGKSVLDLEYLKPDERRFYQREDREMLRTGKMRHHVFDYLYKGKEVHTCLYWASGFRQKNGIRGLIGVIVDINRQSREIRTLRKQLKVASFEKREIVKKSRIDPLTRLYTRGTFDEALLKLASAEGGFSCVMVDIDHFKRVNDTFGHAAGDAVLRELGAVLKRCSRRRDMACRYGGEEFAVLLPDGGLDSAVMIAERIRRCVGAEVHTPDGNGVTVSAGCSEYLTGESGTQVVQRADKALYAAKEGGRNRVCVVQAT